MTKPLAIDLFCGLGGWTEGFLVEGYDVVGFDVERHEYGEHAYPAQLVLQDVRTLSGSQFRDAAIIVASPPCQEFSYMAMPWSRAKAIAADYRSGKRDVGKLTELFDACFRIADEAGVPIVVENVRGAQPWVGDSRWHYGSYHLWGDVPALMPIPLTRPNVIQNVLRAGQRNRDVPGIYADGVKVPGLNWSDRGRTGEAFNTHAERLTTGPLVDGRKGVDGKSAIRNPDKDPRPSHGNSIRRKAASAMIAKIPFPLARHIARVYKQQWETRQSGLFAETEEAKT